MKEGRGEGRKERSDKKVRVNSSLSQYTHEKLDRLATACGITKTSLAAEFIEICLDNENIINFMQEKYKNKSRFRIIPSVQNGKMEFIFTEKKK